jgi:UDP-2,4-diacetamido-2,4,6-trideoxy-beta-L-altropyranose hydrolase
VEAQWTAANQENDAHLVLQSLSKEVAEYILLDHYGLGDSWVRKVAERVGSSNVLVIRDDINLAFSAKSVHLGFASPDELDKSIGLEKVNGFPDYLSSHIPISRSVRERGTTAIPHSNSISSKPIRKVLVYLGNSDVTSYIEKIIHAVKDMNLRNEIELSVISDFENSDLEALNYKPGAPPSVARVSFDDQGDYLDFLMKQDVVIGAGGVSSLERLYLGVPQIVFSVANNQTSNAAALSDWGVLVWAGDLRQLSINDIRARIGEILDDPEPLRQKAVLGKLFLDGLGARRIVQTLVRSRINDLLIRQVKESDSSTLFGWANEPESRRLSLGHQTISPEEHRSWFKSLMSADRKEMSAYVVEHKGSPVGQVRFQLQEANTYTISYGLDLSFRGLGLSTQLVSMGLLEHNKLAKHATYKAFVKRTNVASLKTLESLQFAIVDSSGDWMELSRN